MKKSNVLAIIASIALMISFAVSVSAMVLLKQHTNSTDRDIALVINRMNDIDKMINNLLSDSTIQEIRDAVRDSKVSITLLSKKQTVIIIKLEKILEYVLKRD